MGVADCYVDRRHPQGAASALHAWRLRLRRRFQLSYGRSGPIASYMYFYQFFNSSHFWMPLLVFCCDVCSLPLMPHSLPCPPYFCMRHESGVLAMHLMDTGDECVLQVQCNL
eukprot:6191695-Pleurochrysis_carterae.AAC.2